jgi:prophage maintenance system killer protein
MKKTQSDIVIFQSGKNAVEVRLNSETLWLDAHQIASVFEVDRTVIVKHLQNIYKTEELSKNSTCAKIAQVAADGKKRQMYSYSLDAVIAVGYRVNSKRATQFRIWSTTILRDHLTKGFTLHRQRFEKNAAELEAALELVRKVAQNPKLLAEAGRGLVDVITRYTQTFLILQRYDEGLLSKPRVEKGGKLPTVVAARTSLAKLKSDLILRGEATAFFAKEREDGLAALLGNLDQTIFGNPAYTSIEEKAAHLLYFVIKNHPFIDGNKRSAAFLFVDFLNKNHRLLGVDGQVVINDIGLAALTLLVAESKSENKEIMIKLIINMLTLKKNDQKN